MSGSRSANAAKWPVNDEPGARGGEFSFDELVHGNSRIRRIKAKIKFKKMDRINQDLQDYFESKTAEPPANSLNLRFTVTLAPKLISSPVFNPVAVR